mmetsp:Transcript_3921/g.7658  ORF Transcript_3921/g.7658 Transcript_3921/m.7658 type:complete len:548 (+) Transcript_3921:163-1806(+)
MHQHHLGKFVLFAILISSYSSPSPSNHPLLSSVKSQVDEILACMGSRPDTCFGSKDDPAAAVHSRLTDILANLTTVGFHTPSADFPHKLLVESVMRFLHRNDSLVRREDSAAVPTALRGWPKLGLLWTLLAHMEYYWHHCAFSRNAPIGGAPIGQVSGRPGADTSGGHRACQTFAGFSAPLSPPFPSLYPDRRALLEAASAACGVGPPSKKTGKAYHTRLLNELPLRRHTLAAWVLDLWRHDGGSANGGLPHFELDTRGSVQTVSVERGASIGATARHCTRPGRLRAADPLSSKEEGVLVVAFGDEKVCSALLASTQRLSKGAGGGLRFQLLKYKSSEGHRQMVQKLLTLFRGLPPKTLVVKLDGSDVVLASDAGGQSFRDRWRALGSSVVFSAEAALFYHLGANKVDCSWVARMPPSPTVFRFLNSGGYVGEAADLARMVQAALDLVDADWGTSDDQSVYATWFAHAFNKTASGVPAMGGAPEIKLDYCQDIFATLSGSSATAHFDTLEVKSDGSFRHVLTGSHPIVAHLPGRDRRFRLFVDMILN